MAKVWCKMSNMMMMMVGFTTHLSPARQHVFFSCQHFQHLRVAKPRLFLMTREASLWKLFNEYDVPYADIAWFPQETQLMYSSNA